MRALVWRGGSDLRLEDVEAPRPGPGEVLLKVLATAICGSDVGRFMRPSDPVPPLILGHETVGEVVAAADEGHPPAGTRVAVFPLIADGTCASCRAGHENLCASRSIIGGQRQGAFAELVAVPAAGCYPLSSARRQELGALVEPFACVLHAMRQGSIGPGDRVLVLGAGGIGQLFASAAMVLGSRRVVASDRSASRRAAAMQSGAMSAVELGSVRPDEIDRLTDGEGFDVVVDAIGTSSTRRQAIDQVKSGGRVILLGLHDAVLDASARRVTRDEVTIIGSFAYTRRSFAESVEMVDRGLLDAFFARCEVRRLEDGPRAFGDLATARSSPPRLILTP